MIAICHLLSNYKENITLADMVSACMSTLSRSCFLLGVKASTAHLIWHVIFVRDNVCAASRQQREGVHFLAHHAGLLLPVLLPMLLPPQHAVRCYDLLLHVKPLILALATTLSQSVQGIPGAFRPGILKALLDASGAGKTTLVLLHLISLLLSAATALSVCAGQHRYVQARHTDSPTGRIRGQPDHPQDAFAFCCKKFWNCAGHHRRIQARHPDSPNGCLRSGQDHPHGCAGGPQNRCAPCSFCKCASDSLHCCSLCASCPS